MLVERYQLIKQIGSGACATIYQALDTSTNTHVVIKKWHQFYASSYTEADILYQLLDTDPTHVGYDYTLRILDHFEDPDHSDAVCIVLPLMEGSLYDLLKEYPHGMPDEMVKELTRQLCLSLSYVHACSIIHGDIKPENFLYYRKGTTYHLLLCDFSHAIYKDNPVQPPQLIQTKHYRCMESIIGCGTYTTKSDMTSIGCLVGELYKGKYVLTLSHIDTNDIKQKEEHCNSLLSFFDKTTIRDSISRYPLMESFLHTIPTQSLHTICSDPQWMDIMKKWLHPIPEVRLSATESLQHEWLQT